MQSCNIATGAVCNYTNTIASIPTSEISRSGVGVSQHMPGSFLMLQESRRDSLATDLLTQWSKLE